MLKSQVKTEDDATTDLHWTKLGRALVIAELGYDTLSQY